MTTPRPLAPFALGIALGTALGVALGAGSMALFTTPAARSPAPTGASGPPSANTPAARAAPGGRAAGDPASCADSVRQVEQLQEQVETLQSEVEQLRFARTLQDGQLAQTGATAIAWPDDAPEQILGPSFEQDIEVMVETLGDGQLASMDCDEYPCIALIGVDSEAAADRYFDVGQDHLSELGVPETGVHTMQASTGQWFVAFHATGGSVDVDGMAVMNRVRARMSDAVHDVASGSDQAP